MKTKWFISFRVKLNEKETLNRKKKKKKQQPGNTAHGFTFLEKIIIPRTGRVRTLVRHSVSIVPFGCLTTAALLCTACDALKLRETIWCQQALLAASPSQRTISPVGERALQASTATSIGACCVTVVMALQNRETCTETQKPLWHLDHASQICSCVARSLPPAYRQWCRLTCKQRASNRAHANAWHGSCTCKRRQANF